MRPLLGTDDQLWMETQALRIRSHPSIQRVLADLADHWSSSVGKSLDQAAGFAPEFDRVAFAGIMHALNSFARRPLIHAFGRPDQHNSHGTIPTIRTMHANCDYIYRFIPVDGQSDLLVRGRVHKGMRPHAIEYALVTAAQTYEATLTLDDLAIGPDGSFEISVGPAPADGRRNHFAVGPESHQLLLRDVIADTGQRPLTLELARDAPVDRSDADADMLVEAVHRAIREHIDGILYINRAIVFSSPPNKFPAPAINKGGIYSASQAYSPGNFLIGDGEALVIDLTLAGANYATVPTTNVWGGVGDVLGRCSNLSTPMAQRSDDGSYRMIVAHDDPHHPNWIQTGGAQEGGIFLRWVGLTGGEAPKLAVALRKIADVRQEAAGLANGGPGSATSVHARRVETYRAAMA